MRAPRAILVCATAALAACAPSRTERVLSLDFSPAAVNGGDFAADATSFAGADECDVPDGIESFVVHTYSDQVSDTPDVRYRASDLGSDCKLSLLLPDDASLSLVVEAYGADETLVRKGMVSFAVDSSATSVQEEALVMWPAARILDNAADDGAPDLMWVDVLRQFDRFVFDLNFADKVMPNTAGAANGVYGYIELGGTSTWLLLLDTNENGLILYDQGNGADQGRVPFTFATDANALRIAVPYALVGGSAGTDSVVAPELSVSVTLLDGSDGLNDQLPGDGSTGSTH